MEMESSRRSAPRPPAPGPKKARLAEDDRASIGLAPRPPAAAGGGGGRPTDPRIRAVEREREREGDREDPERGGGAYRPQQQQHIQELVAQYKTGLAELTFNSKPIITNLTIIAGENLHAAKEFAATICANILEVPSDQKLPSLYLLDSIVKNIGRDYIKFFAARLPEVFCKAYKQVDSSVHPGMRHLFGTWKGVFPLAPLQIIGKELGFPPIGSASSGSTAPKPDSQMRPSHSIHINPKYLEARQRLQQSTRAKEARNDNPDSTLSSETSDEGSERLVTIGSSKQWTDLPSIQRPQREQPSDPVLERKGYRDHQFSTNIPQQSDLGVRRVGEKIKERDGPGKSLYAASYAPSELSVNKRDGFDVNHVYGNYRESGSTQANRQVSQLHRTNAINSSQPMSKNWKNSEEEEFLWDDMNSRSTDYGVTSSSMNGGWNTDDADMPASFGRGKHFSVEDERQDQRWNKLDGNSRAKISRREDKVPFFEEIDDRLPQPRQQDIISRNSETTADSLSVQRPESARLASSRWPSHEPLSSVVSLNRANLTSSGRSEGQSISSSGGLSTSVSNALPATGLPSHSIPSTLGPLTSFASKSRGMFGQQIQQPFRPPSPSSLLPPSSAVLPHTKSHTSTDHDHLPSYSLPPLSQKPMQPSIQLKQPPHASVNQDSIPTFALKQSQQSRSLLNSKPSQNLENSSASSTLINQHPLPFLQQPQPDLLLRQTKSESEPSAHTRKPPLLLPSVGSHQTGGFSGISHLNNVSADVSGHSSTNDLIAAIMKSGVALKNPALNNIQPPLPSGPPPTHFLTSSGPLVTSSSVTLSTSHSSAPSITPLPIASLLPPLPPGPPPPSSISGTTSQISSTSGVIPNPLSSLLSSLVAKGLITPSTESPPTEAETSARPSNLKSGVASISEVHIPSTSAAMTISSSPSVKELSLPDSSALVSDPLTNGTSTGMKDLIGIDFRPEIIREFHPSVINSLNDDLRYQCKSCGLRFELQQRLQSHLDWHASKSSKESTFGKVSRKWFADALSWVVRSVGTPYGPLYAGLNKVATAGGEECEPSVPADESQCICALCGEPFEDLYSLERDEWMYKGTVYLELPDRQDEIGSVNESEGLVPIVHAKCMSKNSGNLEEDEKI